MKTMGENIKALRESRGFTQDEVARQMKCKSAYVSALWPWPMEDWIKAELAAMPATINGDTMPTAARGFATGTSLGGATQTLTRYIWESLGNVIPAGIYGDAGDTTAPVTSSNKSGRYTASQTVTLTANETATTVYCQSTSADCTPSTSYTAPVKVLVNRSFEKLCYKSTDSASNAETAKCTVFEKKRRK